MIHNGIEDTFNGDRSAPRHWAFVGRLSPEKGVRELIEAWPENELLRVAGDGPLLEELRALGRPGVHLLGAVSPQDVDKLFKHSWGLIFPSRWLETGGPPLVVAEAAMHGVPVLARTGSSGADFVEHHGAGRTYLHESQVPRLLDEVRENHAVLSTASREAYLADLNLGSWIQRLEGAYAEAQTIRGTGR